MKLRPFLLNSIVAGAALVLAACNKSDSPSVGATDSVGPDGIRIIRLTGDDKLLYNVTEITAAPGEKLNIELTNIGTMPRQTMAHNWILLNKPMEVGEVNALAMAASTKPPEFMPDDQSAILAHTKMLGSGEKDTVQITAPATPGTYPYFCSFPGHFALMRGNLIVKAK
jgi:azurin